jgi:hypothetical protein
MTGTNCDLFTHRKYLYPEGYGYRLSQNGGNHLRICCHNAATNQTQAGFCPVALSFQIVLIGCNHI